MVQPLLAVLRRSDYQTLLGQFRSDRVPLDTLSIDTDFKREASSVGADAAAIVAGAPGKRYSWDGWEWDPSLFGDPKGFIDWAHGEGLSVALDIHPSITTDDPQYAAANSQAGGLRISSGQCRILIADPTGQCARVRLDQAAARSTRTSTCTEGSSATGPTCSGSTGAATTRAPSPRG